MNENDDPNENLGALLGSVASSVEHPEQILQLGEAIESERDSANPNVVTVTRWGSASEAKAAEGQDAGQRRCE